TSVLLEAPGRVGATLADLAAIDGERPVAVVRELTKVHEEVWRGTAAAWATRRSMTLCGPGWPMRPTTARVMWPICSRVCSASAGGGSTRPRCGCAAE